GSFQHHTWHISNWRSLEKRVTGPEFEIGGEFCFFRKETIIRKWYPFIWILLIRKEHSWLAREFTIALVLWNPHEPTQYISHNPKFVIYNAHHRFTGEEPDWGLQRFTAHNCKELFYTLQTSDTPVETTELARSFIWDSSDLYLQHYIQEFNRVLQEYLE
ncbi:18864_t:CDS:2, partial [Gigaspora margarita]